MRIVYLTKITLKLLITITTINYVIRTNKYKIYSLKSCNFKIKWITSRQRNLKVYHNQIYPQRVSLLIKYSIKPSNNSCNKTNITNNY